MDRRTPEQLAALGIVVRHDKRGKRHITMRADPFVQFHALPKTVACECGASKTFMASGSVAGWVPPHPGVPRWTCPECRAELAPLVMGAR
jgi:rubredoxin